MKKQILSKAMCENETNQILNEYGMRKPRRDSQQQQSAFSTDSFDGEEEIVEATDRHIQIIEKANARIAAAAASNEPAPEYEIVWRKQDQPGNRRKPFTPSTQLMNEEEDDNGGGAFEGRRLKGCTSPSSFRSNNGCYDQLDITGAREPPPMIDMPKRSRKEIDYGKELEPILVVYGPDHFTHHAGSGHRGNRGGTMYKLEDGCVVDGLKEDDDIPQRELTPLELALSRERQLLEYMD